MDTMLRTRALAITLLGVLGFSQGAVIPQQQQLQDQQGFTNEAGAVGPADIMREVPRPVGEASRIQAAVVNHPDHQRDQQAAAGHHGFAMGGGGGGMGGGGMGGGGGGMGGGAMGMGMGMGGGGGGGHDYFQYAHNPEYGHYEHGHRRGNDYHHIERYEKGKDWTFKTKVKWHDKHAGHGEHYWDYNHTDSHGHDGHGGGGGGGGGGGDSSNPVPSYEPQSTEKRNSVVPNGPKPHSYQKMGQMNHQIEGHNSLRQSQIPRPQTPF